jgi:hypothetical protein
MVRDRSADSHVREFINSDFPHLFLSVRSVFIFARTKLSALRAAAAFKGVGLKPFDFFCVRN